MNKKDAQITIKYLKLLKNRFKELLNEEDNLSMGFVALDWNISKLDYLIDELKKEN